jgi:hypothetical protein
MSDTFEAKIEAMARAIEPETFSLPRINLYAANYERAYAKARAAAEAIGLREGSVIVPTAEMEEMRSCIVTFGALWAVPHSERYGLNGLDPAHYDMLEKYGARMDSFKRATNSPT